MKYSEARCKACICQNSCYQEGLRYDYNNKDCKDNTLLVKDSNKLIKKWMEA